MIFDDKWLNASTSMKSIKDVLDAKKTFIVTSIQTIKDCGEETTEKALQMFKANLNLQEVLAWINQYRLQKEQILEKQRLAEQERIRKEDEERARQEERERQAREEAERKKAEEEMAKQEREQKQESDGFCVATSEQKGFASNVQPEQHGFGGFQPEPEHSCFQPAEEEEPQQGFSAFQPEQQSQPIQGFSSAVQGWTDEHGFDQPPHGFQTAPKHTVFTVRVPAEQANHFEELIKQWGYTNFDRR